MASPKAPKGAARALIRERNRATYNDLILEAAERVFADRGYSGTRMSDVAAEAQVSTGTLYNYFRSKDDVFRRLLELRSERFHTEMERRYKANTDPIERLSALTRFVFEHMSEHRAMYAVFVELGATSESSIGSIGGDKLVDQYTQYVSIFERAFRSAARAKRLRRTSARPAELAQALTGAINGLIRAWVITGASSPLGRKADVIIEVFLGEVVQ